MSPLLKHWCHLATYESNCPLLLNIAHCTCRDPLARTASPQPPQPQPPLPDSQLQLQYAMALVRMVNGIADSSQKGRVAASVASLAAAAGEAGRQSLPATC